MIDVIQICEAVLERLSIMDYEKSYAESIEKLIFPNKIQAKGNIRRVSEQELRFLFVEEFKIVYPGLYYSIETPTEEKYKFGISYEEIVKNVDIHKTSASIDMCVFNKVDNSYNRILNIEFKHKNTKDKNIAKDVLKLMREIQNGAFILLLDNTRKGSFKGTLWNENNTGIFNKLYNSFDDFHNQWENGNSKHIQLILISLRQRTLIYRRLNYKDLSNLENIFCKKWMWEYN